MTNDEGMTKSEARNQCDADDSFWKEHAELVVPEEMEKNRVYDLEDRTARFGEAVIDFAKTIPQNPLTNRLVSQLVGAGTSVGANYGEADDSVSKNDFLKSKAKNVEQKTNARCLFRHSSFVNPSCFVIRISSF